MTLSHPRFGVASGGKRAGDGRVLEDGLGRESAGAGLGGVEGGHENRVLGEPGPDVGGHTAGPLSDVAARELVERGAQDLDGDRLLGRVAPVDAPAPADGDSGELPADGRLDNALRLRALPGGLAVGPVQADEKPHRTRRDQSSERHVLSIVDARIRRKGRHAGDFLLVYLDYDEIEGTMYASLTVDHMPAGSLGVPWRRSKGGRWKARVPLANLGALLGGLGFAMAYPGAQG